MSSLTFEPLIAPAAWVALAAVSALVLGWYARLRPLVMTRPRWLLSLLLQALGMVSVLVILLNPIWNEVVPPPAGKPVLTVLVDQSASMRVADGLNGQSRFQSAATLGKELVSGSGGRFDVTLRTFGETTATVTADELGTKTPDRQLSDFAG